MARAVAEAMFSQDGEVTEARLEAHLTEVDHHVSAASAPLRFGLRIALFVVRVAPLLLFFRLRLLENLSVDERVAVLARLERTGFAPLSLAFIGWRTVLTLVFYEDPVELANIGYAGEERFRYKRRLPLQAARGLAGAIETLVPAPGESGVRLTQGEHADIDSERPARPREVA